MLDYHARHLYITRRIFKDGSSDVILSGYLKGKRGALQRITLKIFSILASVLFDLYREALVV